MAAVISEGDIDFAAYERETNVRAKVRKASVFADELKARYAIREQSSSGDPTVSSTKLRGRIEFRPGEVTVWAGYNGHRKSMFTGQVALDLMDAGQRVLIASLEMQPERTLERMGRQATAQRWPNDRLVDQFLRWSDNKLWLYDHYGHVTPSQCLAVCRYFAEELKGQHVFIDSMMKIVQTEDTMDESKRFVTDLCQLAHDSGLHVHLIAHCRKPSGAEDRPPSKYDIRGTSAISDQCSNVILVWQNKSKKEALERDPQDREAKLKPDALVIVDKQRNGEWEGKAQLWFDDATMRFCDDALGRVEPYVMERLS